MPESGFPPPARDLQTIADKLEITELVQLERLWRDSGEWDLVAEAYTEDAVIRTTWFEGNARQFALGSKDMAARGRHSKHPIQPLYVHIVGDRALIESRGQIQFRTAVGGVGADLTQYVRFVSRAVRTADGWRLASFEGIYERGTIAPIDPSAVLPLDWADVEASSPRASYQLWAWSHLQRGYPPTPADLLGDDEPDQVRAFHEGERRWLHGDS